MRMKLIFTVSLAEKAPLLAWNSTLIPVVALPRFGLLKAHKLAPDFTFLLSWLRIQIQIQENLFKAELNA